MEPQPFIGDLLIALHKGLKTIAERELKPLDIGMGQLQILMLFYSQPGVSRNQQDVSRSLGVDKGNISRSIGKLLEKGWLESSPEDPRKLRLTESANLRRGAVLACLTSLENHMTRGLDKAELTDATRILRRLLTNLEE